MRADRMLLVLWIVLTLGGIVLGLAIVMLIGSPPAHGASICERHNMQKVFTRGGRSWRCKRVRAHRVHQVALRIQEFPKISGKLELEPQIRTVRIIPIINGLTVHERIDRAFDMLVRFPIEDEP